MQVRNVILQERYIYLIDSSEFSNEDFYWIEYLHTEN